MNPVMQKKMIKAMYVGRELNATFISLWMMTFMGFMGVNFELPGGKRLLILFESVSFL